MSWIKAVGIGPGDNDLMTQKARNVLKECDVVVGYTPYIDIIKPLVEGKEVISTGMRREVERCEEALTLVREGKRVCVVSSGDPGIYGMAGLLFELSVKNHDELSIEVIPGISAVNAAASLLGAPLMHDFAVISLSDHLTPWEVIEKRLELAAQGDFVIALYNPKSRERIEHFDRAVEIMLRHKNPTTPVGIVKNAARVGEHITVTNLSRVIEEDVDMTTIVIVGNKNTFEEKGRMITPRGYIL
jgi:precorrin-3B C17-methyltransferase